MSLNDSPGLSDAREYWLKVAQPRLAALCDSRGDMPTLELHARRQALAAESAAIRSFLWRFDESFNELQPIFRLPSEVLTYIFTIVEAFCPAIGGEVHDMRYIGYEVLPPKEGRHKYVDWLAVTRVCRQWRKDALACSSLWSRIPLDMGTKGIAAFLSRSRNSALTIDCTVNKRTSNLMKVMQPAHLARTRELRIPTAFLKLEDDAILSVLQNPAPRLEVLALPVKHATAHIRRRTAPITLPNNLLNNEAPCLRIFDVHQIGHWPLYPALFAKLRVFSVNNTWARDYTFPLLSEMRQALQSMPLIEALRLNNSMARGHDLTGDEDLIALPRLQLLELSGPLIACSAVLRPLRVAAGCKVFISCTSELTAAREQTTALIDDLNGTGFNVGLAPESLAITLSTGYLRVTAFEDTAEDPRLLHSYGSLKQSLSRSTVFSFSLTLPRARVHREVKCAVEHAQRLLAHTLPVHAITSASVSTPSILGDQDARSTFEPLWAAALAPCTRLAMLHIAGEAAYVLLRGLAQPQPEGPLFPALSLLVFDSHQISRVQTFEGVSLYHILLAALQQRTIASVQMPEAPLLSQADMGALRALTDLHTYPGIRTTQWDDDPGAEFFMQEGEVGQLPLPWGAADGDMDMDMAQAEAEVVEDIFMLDDHGPILATGFQPAANDLFADGSGV